MEATKVSTQFCRSDDKLSALRDTSQSWKPSSASRPRPANAETNVRAHRTTSNTGSRIPPDVYAQMPLGEDGRKLCLKILSKPGCQFTKCSNAHFRPESLAGGVKNLISEWWGGPSALYRDKTNICSDNSQSGEKEERERYKIFMATLNQARVLNQATVYEKYQKHAVGLSPPPLRPNLIDDVDADQVQGWSTFAEQSKWSLSDVVRLLRGQTASDPRPNKDLFELAPPLDTVLALIVAKWNSIVRHGVQPQWSANLPARQSTCPQNHAGIHRVSKQIRRHLRKGQHEGRYLIVSSHLLELWPEIFISPVGVVDKAGAATVDIRLINDYSIPPAYAVNDFTDRESLPSISYNPPRDIAKRIHYLTSSHLGERMLMMIGDVSGAFRHIPIHADSAHMIAFVFEDLLIVDLLCGFGWCGSLAFYSLAGSLINALYEHGNKLTRQFHGNVWCDDHTCIEVDRGLASFNANISLRRAIATVLGPTAINEQKFTSWSTTCKALGLLWDTSAGTVSIPVDKLTKASVRVDDLVSSKFVTQTTLPQVIGSLRHVASCFPPAHAFFQCLHETATACSKYGRRVLSTSTLDDGSKLCYDIRRGLTPFRSFISLTCQNPDFMCSWTQVETDCVCSSQP